MLTASQILKMDRNELYDIYPEASSYLYNYGNKGGHDIIVNMVIMTHREAEDIAKSAVLYYRHGDIESGDIQRKKLEAFYDESEKAFLWVKGFFKDAPRR